MTENMPENRVFNSRFGFALNRFLEINRLHLENGAELRKSPNLVEKLIGTVGPGCHLLLAYTFAPLAMAVAMSDAEYSPEKCGYISKSYREFLEEKQEEGR